MIGLLFDIDGCLTLPGQTISILDTKLMDRLLQLHHPLALITGRSDGWLRKQYRDMKKMSYLEIPTYIEFGLAKINNDNVIVNDKSLLFLELRIKLIELLADLCKKEGVYFEPETWYSDYPDHGSLWVEDKHIQLSIAENIKVPTTEVHRLCNKAWQPIKDKVRILYHHLGIDVIPLSWSKKMATAHFVQDLNEEKYTWYVFGDNESDKEMIQGLTTTQFVSTRDGASSVVWKTLEEIGIINS